MSKPDELDAGMKACPKLESAFPVAIAFPQLVSTGSSRSSGFFDKKEPLCTPFKESTRISKML